VRAFSLWRLLAVLRRALALDDDLVPARAAVGLVALSKLLLRLARAA
jgi:hypothetical protein